MAWRRFGSSYDANHHEIVEALQQLGYAVLDLARVGKGCPDILIGKGGDLWLVEIKTEKGGFKKSQLKWAQEWTGKPPVVARTLDDVLNATGERLFQ